MIMLQLEIFQKNTKNIQYWHGENCSNRQTRHSTSQIRLREARVVLRHSRLLLAPLSSTAVTN